MPVNKNAIIRYRALDRCFSNRLVKYDINKLIEAVSKALEDFDEDVKPISRAQVYADISFMKSNGGYSIDLDEDFKDGRTRYYRYTDPKFSINNLPLNETEINQLKSAITILSQFKGLPQFEWIQELIPKLKQDISVSQYNSTIIEFDSNRYLTGIEYIGTLYNAIFYKRVLKITYQPFESEKPNEYIIHPYYLKQYNNRWFLFGYNPETSKYDWTLALDRILSIKETKNIYSENSLIDWSDYFEDMIGVTKKVEKKIENVVLHFKGIAGKYIQSKPVHGSQKANWINDKLLEIKLQVFTNYELESFILSWGESVEVIKPKSLQSLIRNRLEKAMLAYP